jgi:LPS sulfotransferase NodH
MEKTCFVLFASQRTGSNVFNQNLNQFPNVVCHGEVFNPAFVGMTGEYLERFGGKENAKAVRNGNPLAFMRTLIASTDAEFVGFHLFPGHIREVIDAVLSDASIKKICLRRSLFQSYVSLRIAQQTDVWLVRHKRRFGSTATEQKPVKIEFKAPDFERYERELKQFWNHVFGHLEKSGQEYFPVWYKQVNELETVNKCAEFIGIKKGLTKLKPTLKKQNPSNIEEKVSNYNDLLDYARARGLEKHLL